MKQEVRAAIDDMYSKMDWFTRMRYDQCKEKTTEAEKAKWTAEYDRLRSAVDFDVFIELKYVEKFKKETREFRREMRKAHPELGRISKADKKECNEIYREVCELHNKEKK